MTRGSYAPSPAPSPRTVGDTVNFTAFTAASPTVATAEDASMLAQGAVLTLAAVAGDPAAMAAIDGASAEVSLVNGVSVTLMLDLSAVDVTGLAGTGTVTADAPAPAPSPEPPPVDPADAATALLTRYPSPGVGVLPVDPQEIESLGRKLGGRERHTSER